MDTQSAKLITDIAGLDSLKAKARQDQSAALGEVSRQFETLLVGMMVKSMRQASLGEGLLDGNQSLFYRDIYDQQLASHLSDRGIGLADMIERQLGGDAAKQVPDGKDLPAYLATRTTSAQQHQQTGSVEKVKESAAEAALDSPQRFVEQLMPHARKAAAKLGLSPEALLAQAALETGWGRSVIHGSGGNSHNLFGIKADGRWDGNRATVTTLEFEDGVAVRRKDPFRSYGSYADSFNDYVDFLRSGERYSEALANTSDPKAYFTSLQKAGYATDPRYADKIMRVLESREMRGALQRLELNAEGPSAPVGKG